MELLDFWFDALGQFVGGRGGPGNELVRFGLAALLWSGLFVVAWARRCQPDAERERLLLWGFGLGFGRESFMFLAFLADFFSPLSKPWHLVFPPIDHALTTASVVVVAAAFIRYLKRDDIEARNYLRVSLVVVALCYLATFLWWPQFLQDHPDAKFGQTWCDWLFRGGGVALVGWAMMLLLSTRSWLKRLVVAALVMFLADDLLKIVDMAWSEHYEPYLAPIRHALHIIGIGLIGMVYLQEMQQTSSRLAAAVENSGDSILIFSTARIIEYVNRTFCRYTGFDPKEVVGRSFEEVMYTPRHSESFYKAFWARLESGRSWRGPMYTPRRDGGDFEGEGQVTPLRNRHEEVTGYVCMTRDISREREIERRMTQAQKLEAIGTLAGGIAHDFNNLLTPIMGFAELTRNRLAVSDPLRGNMDQVIHAAERARDLIGQILTMSRQRKQEKQPIEVLPLLKEALKLLRASLPATIEIRQSLGARHSLVMADASQINQIIINLVTNAGQAMGEDGGILEVGLEEVVVDAEFAARHVGVETGMHLCLWVRDSGPGLAADVEERIFEPFFTTRQDSGGTGLGLAIVQGVVQDHHGAIEVESAPGVGTLFRVFLPLVEGTPVQMVVPPETSQPGSERLLLVDDEEHIVALGSQALQNLGYQVAATTEPQKALELLSHAPNDYDLLVTDLTMPGMTGLSLAQQAFEISPGLPVILCTGYLKEDTRQRATTVGIRAVLPKPYTMSELNLTIRHILDA